MTGQLSALAQGKAAGVAAGYTSKVLKTGATIQNDSELDDGYYEVGVAKSYTVNTSGSQSGTTNVDLTHLVSDTGAFTTADKTYTDAGKCGVFKAAGGETIIITGSASNNGTFTTVSATANTVVFVEAITDEADAPATTFKKREAISNNTVLDNNTGLTWLRYYSTKMGAAGDGKMFWSGSDYDIFQWCAACNAASVGGYTDWRIANLLELWTLPNFEAGVNNSVPDTTAFPSYSSTTVHWSSTAQRTVPASYALFIAFSLPSSGRMVKISGTPATCALVRGGIA